MLPLGAGWLGAPCCIQRASPDWKLNRCRMQLPLCPVAMLLQLCGSVLWLWPCSWLRVGSPGGSSIASARRAQCLYAGRLVQRSGPWSGSIPERRSRPTRYFLRVLRHTAADQHGAFPLMLHVPARCIRAGCAAIVPACQLAAQERGLAGVCWGRCLCVRPIAL
jgi:hypothetical protein